MALLLIALAAGLSGCATIMVGDQQTLKLDSLPGGAKLTLTNDQGRKIYSGTTPASIQVKRADGWRQHQEYRMKLEKPGYLPVDVELKWKREPWFWGNWLFAPVGLGFVGLLIVDPLTGAMWRIDPEELTIPLTLDR